MFPEKKIPEKKNSEKKNPQKLFLVSLIILYLLSFQYKWFLSGKQHYSYLWLMQWPTLWGQGGVLGQGGQ